MLWNPKKKQPLVDLGEPKPKTQLRLFCFPYAGGGASIFRQWLVNIPQGVEVCAV
jgi:medium-chain acyl-[acyl-carrier-protein] hydrolase